MRMGPWRGWRSTPNHHLRWGQLPLRGHHHHLRWGEPVLPPLQGLSGLARESGAMRVGMSWSKREIVQNAL